MTQCFLSLATRFTATRFTKVLAYHLSMDLLRRAWVPTKTDLVNKKRLDLNHHGTRYLVAQYLLIERMRESIPPAPGLVGLDEDKLLVS